LSDNINYDSEYERDSVDYLSAVARLHDVTAHVLVSATSLSTAGAANTAVSIVDLSKWEENTLYIDSTGGPATNAGTTGLTVFFEARPASAAPWVTFRTESGVDTSSTTLWKIIGSGIADSSGITHFGDVRITIENTTDSSGTATVNAYVLSRTP